jgi:hypothetical protein
MEEYEFNSIYIKEWDKTILDIVIFKDDEVAMYCESWFGELTQDEIDIEFDRLYEMALNKL